METVSFTQMAEGTREDYLLLQRLEKQYNETLPDRLLAAVEALKTSLSGYQVTRYEHSLQSATRAYRDGQDEAYVVAALLHDIGDVLAPYTHGEMVAAILRPYLPERIVWIVKYHGLFQMVYYAHHYGEDRNARDAYKDHPWYDDCAEFCEKYDQNCFDPSYDSLPLAFFEPMVRRIFTQEPAI
ncbi:MAG: HD domain-containing protein [Ardenticatenaceae bacterium]|nr:HD domain-containing protein [Ardenticatenaceae bacterium]